MCARLNGKLFDLWLLVCVCCAYGRSPPTQEEMALYNRVKGAQNIPNPYENLELSQGMASSGSPIPDTFSKAFLSFQVCTGTATGTSSTENDYFKWDIFYRDCVYLDGNLEISNFRVPPNKTIDDYDFAFLHNITEITGYLLIFNSDIEALPLKSLKIVRGWKLFNDQYSVYIDSNKNLATLDLRSLKGFHTRPVIDWRPAF
jgi:hypothetical protein